MELRLRKTIAVSVVAILSLFVVNWMLQSGNGDGDVAQAAPGDPYGTMTIDDFIGVNKMTTDIRDHSWELLSAPPAAGGGTGGGTGKADFNPFVVTRAISANSPFIAEKIADSFHFPKVTVKIFKPGTSQVAATYVLTEVEISRLTESEGASATEEIEFVYDKIKWTQNNNDFCFEIAPYIFC